MMKTKLTPNSGIVFGIAILLKKTACPLCFNYMKRKCKILGIKYYLRINNTYLIIKQAVGNTCHKYT